VVRVCLSQLSHRATLLQRNGALPARETCELLVLDRSVDPVAPVIHEWTYEALVYDLLSLDENIIRCVLHAVVRQPNDSRCMIRDLRLRAQGAM
jgi:hypothetical protein